jgi:hypothetical protein
METSSLRFLKIMPLNKIVGSGIQFLCYVYKYTLISGTVLSQVGLCYELLLFSVPLHLLVFRIPYV